MPKQPPPEWSKVLQSVLKESGELAAHWLPKGASELEKQALKAKQEVQDFNLRRKQAAALKPQKARLLWLLPLPLIPATVFSLTSGNLVLVVANALAYSLFVAGAMLAGQGFKQEVDPLKLTGTRLIPFKAFGALTVSAATALTAWVGAAHSAPIALIFAVGTGVAFIMLYGLDPSLKATAADSYTGSNKRVSEALQLAEKKISSIEQASLKIQQSELNQRLVRIISLAREILAEIARDPRDLRLARKFLNTYLDGASKVVSGYAQSHTNGRSSSLETNFRRVLVTIEDVFKQQLQHLLDNDLNDLDIHMEVLETQLKNEGLN